MNDAEKTKEAEVAAQITNRMAEEKRKAQIKQEMKMAEARRAANLKNNGENNKLPPQEIRQQPKGKTTVISSTPDLKPDLIKPEVNNEVKDNPANTENLDELVTKKDTKKIVEGLNKSFAWLENYVKVQNAHNDKINKFIINLALAIEEFNKK